MTPKTFAPLVCCCLLALSLTGAMGHGHGTSRKAPSNFAPVKAILQAKCIGCHNANRHPESVNLSSYETLMKSGQPGPIVVPGQPEKSKLLLYVDGTKQPRMPMRQAPLSKADIATIRNWIKAGAKA